MEGGELKAIQIGFANDFILMEEAPGFQTQLHRLAGEYLKSRIDWANAEPNNLTDIDIARSRAHDAFISTLNALTRHVATKGSTLEWRRALARGGDVQERKNIGDFACYLAFETAIRAR